VLELLQKEESSLDVEGIDLRISSEEILGFIAEGRRVYE